MIIKFMNAFERWTLITTYKSIYFFMAKSNVIFLLLQFGQIY